MIRVLNILTLTSRFWKTVIKILAGVAVEPLNSWLAFAHPRMGIADIRFRSDRVAAASRTQRRDVTVADLTFKFSYPEECLGIRRFVPRTGNTSVRWIVPCTSTGRLGCRTVWRWSRWGRTRRPCSSVGLGRRSVRVCISRISSLKYIQNYKK